MLITISFFLVTFPRRTGLNTTTVPVLQSELSHSHRRGTLVIAETAITIAGIALANWVDTAILYGGHIHGSAQWRLALALQCAFPLFVYTLLPLIPESPRWLAQQGRYDEVRAAVAQIEGHDLSVSSELVVSEANKIIRVAEHEAAIAVGWREIFKSGELQNGRRVALGAFGQFMQQFGYVEWCSRLDSGTDDFRFAEESTCWLTVRSVCAIDTDMDIN